jgi:hypothetical protein
VALLVSATPACLLYTDPINSAPRVSLVPLTMPVHRHQMVQVEAQASDPDGDAVTLSWSVARKPCVDAVGTDWKDVAAEPPRFQRLALMVSDHGALCVRVIGQDSHGARTASEPLEIVPANREPAVTVAVAGGTGPVPLFSTVRVEAGPGQDEDGDPLTFTWKARDPAGAPLVLVDCEAADKQRVRCFVAERPGDHQVTVEVSDGVAGSKPVATSLDIKALPDQPPCIESSDPSADTGVVVQAVTDPPRRFEVRRVKDDGHPFPAGARGGATFQWFTAREGSPTWTRELGYDRSTFDVSASRFDDARPGSVYRVRVEARDPERELAAAQRELELACEDRAICQLPASAG